MKKETDESRSLHIEEPLSSLTERYKVVLSDDEDDFIIMDFPIGTELFIQNESERTGETFDELFKKMVMEKVNQCQTGRIITNPSHTLE